MEVGLQCRETFLGEPVEKALDETDKIFLVFSLQCFDKRLEFLLGGQRDRALPLAYTTTLSVRATWTGVVSASLSWSGTYRPHSSTCLFPGFSTEIWAEGDRAGPSWLQDDAQRSALLRFLVIDAKEALGFQEIPSLA